ncbi:hypothetical protein [Haemophilus pittmaniae]|uniref:hypothetical protein n=1 Tax=Haemophilus pittmaniae TaxID=249188 RepID=UPI0028DB3C84|nr:hypothetical protein [Haemophilus pittmaniae]
MPTRENYIIEPHPKGLGFIAVLIGHRGARLWTSQNHSCEEFCEDEIKAHLARLALGKNTGRPVSVGMVIGEDKKKPTRTRGRKALSNRIESFRAYCLLRDKQPPDKQTAYFCKYDMFKLFGLSATTIESAVGAGLLPHPCVRKTKAKGMTTEFWHWESIKKWLEGLQ